MKILIVTHSFFPYSVGGREKMVKYYADILSENNRVKIFTTSNSIFSHKIVKSKNLEIEYFPVIKIPLFSTFYRIPLFLFFKMLKEEFDICYAHDLHHLTTLLSAIVCRVKRKKLIVSEHGYYIKNGINLIHLFSRLYEILFLNFISRSARKVVVASNFMKKELETNFKIESKKIIVFPNFINLKEYSFRSRDLKKVLGIKGKLLLCVGRPSPEKGFEYALLAFKKVLKEMNEVYLLIVGPKRSYINILKKLAKNLGVEKNTCFLSDADDELVKAAFYSSDIILIPSIYEPFGIVALEAMAYAKIIIASRVGGLKEFLKNGKNAILVPPKNYNKIAKTIIQVLKDKKFKKLGKRAKEDVKKFDLPDKYEIENLFH